MTKVPFQFKYAHSVCFQFEGISFLLSTSHTSLAIETFWIRQIQNVNELGNSNLTVKINDPIGLIEAKEDNGLFYHKLQVETKNKKWSFFAGEIYDAPDGKLVYKLYDEMILGFSEPLEASKSEQKVIESIKT